MRTKSFEHFHLINKSIRELYRILTPEHVARFTDEFSLTEMEADDIWRQPIVGCGHLVRRIAKHFQLPSVAVIVDYNNTMQPPGRVTLTSHDHMFVEIKSNIRWPKPLAALLAHEVSHIFLHSNNIHFTDTFENEVLTDTTTAFLGFGATMLNGVTETQTERQHYSWNNQRVVQTQTQHFGYLTLDEFGYVLAKREALLKKSCTAGLDKGTPTNSYEAGRLLVVVERSNRPFVARPRHRRMFGLLDPTPHPTPVSGKFIEFSCPNCDQALRIPELYEEMLVRCKICASRFTCFS